ncbi:MAG TPA: phosphodiester glycosidase family protein [Bryobacteraceae bacterium]|nr:phosphodiester glycosidase family protein [Bryobacteraceae bacterium]
MQTSHVTFPFLWAPEAAGIPAQVFTLEMDPQRTVPALSVQAAWNGSRGLIRGLIEDGVLVEDHIREELDEEGRLRDAGRRIAGPGPIRRQVWTVSEHRTAWLARHPGESIAGWIGNGNLLANPHFVGWSDGTLFTLRGEPLERRTYTCLVVRKTGVSIEPLAASGFSAEVKCATFGQQVVKDGNPIGRKELIAKAAAGEFFDLRHVFLFPRVDMGPQRWMDAGLAAFHQAGGGLNARAIEDALRGKPVECPVEQFSENQVRRALEAKGYRDYEFHGGLLRFIPREGIYPHDLIGLREDGTLMAVAAGGLSNRVGLSIEGAGELMRSLGARDALLLDNGGDVTLGCGDETIFSSKDGVRGRLRSVLFFRGAEVSACVRYRVQQTA